MLFLLLKNKLSYKQIYLFSFLGYFSHGILDACTSYGTVLFWPFSDFRVGLNIISIIDPIFTGTILVCFLISLIKNSTLTIRSGLLLSIFYLSFNYTKYNQVKHYISDIAVDRDHEIEKLFLKPTIGNNFLWRSVYRNNNRYFIDAIYFPLFGTPQYRNGPQVEVIDKDTIFPEIRQTPLKERILKDLPIFRRIIFIYIPIIKTLLAIYVMEYSLMITSHFGG